MYAPFFEALRAGGVPVSLREYLGFLEALRAGFESGTYRPYAINDDCIFGLATANEGYKIVLEDTRRDRVVIDPRR